MPHVLFAAAPSTAQRPHQIDTNVEFEAIQSRLRAVGKDCAMLSDLGKGSIGERLRAEAPTVLHISAHGTIDGKLVIEQGLTHWLETDALSFSIFLGEFSAHLKLALFCACNSAGMALKAVQHLAAAIGFEGEVPDEDAKAFTANFYERLKDGQDDYQAFVGAKYETAWKSTQVRPYFYFQPGLRFDWDKAAWTEVLAELKRAGLLEACCAKWPCPEREPPAVYEWFRAEGRLFELRYHIEQELALYHPKIQGFERGLVRRITYDAQGAQHLVPVDRETIAAAAKQGLLASMLRAKAAKLDRYAAALSALELLPKDEQEALLADIEQYLPLYCARKDTPDSPQKALEHFSQLLLENRPGRKRRFLLLGRAGLGKTTLMAHLFVHLVDQRSPFAFVFAPLHHAPFSLLEQLPKNVKARTVLLLDGADELYQMGWGTKAIQQKLDALAQDFEKVLFTARPELFERESDEGQKGEGRYAEAYERYELQPLTQLAAEAYVKGCFPMGSPALMDALALVKSPLDTMFRRPMVLRHVRYIIEQFERRPPVRLLQSEKTTQGRITEYEVLEAIVGYWLEREAQQSGKGASAVQAYWAACGKLAEKMYRKEQTQLGDEKGKGYLEAEALQALIGQETRRFPLVQRYKDKGFRFAHASIKHFFYARLLYAGHISEAVFRKAGINAHYKEAWALYRDHCLVAYGRAKQARGEGVGVYESAGSPAVPVFNSSLPLYVWAVQRKAAAEAYRTPYHALETWTGYLSGKSQALRQCLAVLAEQALKASDGQLSLAEVEAAEQAYGVALLAGRADGPAFSPHFFFVGAGESGFAFLHPMWAEFFLLQDLLLAADEAETVEADLAELPSDRFLFLALFAQEVAWLGFWGQAWAARLEVRVDVLYDAVAFEQGGYQGKGPEAYWQYWEDRSPLKPKAYKLYAYALLEWSETDHKPRGAQGGRLGLRAAEAELRAALWQLPLRGSIRFLDLAHNGLKQPLDLRAFKRLERIDLSGNPDLDLAACQWPAGLAAVLTDRPALPPAVAKPSLGRNGAPTFDQLWQDSSLQPTTMVRVEAGECWMGSRLEDLDADADEKPRHKVAVPAFEMAKHPVTVAEFACFVRETGYLTTAEREGWSLATFHEIEGKTDKTGKTGKNILSEKLQAGCNWRYDEYGRPNGADRARHPVVHISWEDAKAYCAWLSARTGRQYALPTEAQWEYAAMGGHLAPKDDAGIHYAAYPYAGSADLDEVAWYFNPGGWELALRAVGQKQHNELGLYDMSGNVWEWCEDDWHGHYWTAPEDGRAWVDTPRGSARVVRGGAWFNRPRLCQLAYRYRFVPSFRLNALGFRLCAALQFT